MLVNLIEILKLAEEKGCAVGAFNTPNLECVNAVISAAERLDVPVIISHAELHEEVSPLFIDALSADLPIVQAHPVKEDAFSMTVMGQVFTERKAAGEAIIKACMLMSDPEKPLDLGEYRGFPMQLHCNGFKFKVTMKQNLTYTAELSDDPVGSVTRINNALEGMKEKIENNQTRLATLERELKNAQ